jgi:hypothetical protein
MDERTWGPLLGLIGVVVVVAPIAWAVLKGRGWLLAKANKSLEETYKTVGAATDQRDGYVSIRFPVYVGALVTIQEITTSVWVPRQNARKTVNTLAGFSLKYGLITILAPYVLFMVLLNYILHLPRLVNT